jgi:hypothetical protein
MLVMFVGMHSWNITLQEKYSCNDVTWLIFLNTGILLYLQAEREEGRV